MYLDAARKAFEELQTFTKEVPVPCTEAEVRELEQKVGLTLPLAYKEFLLWMGHSAGGLLVGTDIFYEHLPLQEAAIELLAENNVTEKLPDTAFVFMMHQGYQFMFFDVSAGDDPPIHYYLESKAENYIRWNYEDNLNKFLAIEIEAHIY